MNKILMVDDDELTATIARILKDRGYYIETASSAGESIKKIINESFDLVLLDLIMPGVAGFDLLDEIKKIRHDVKVIMMTAYSTPDNIMQALQKGANSFVSKPFKLKDLFVLIQHHLEGHAGCVSEYRHSKH